jgi:hypothetical protein
MIKQPYYTKILHDYPAKQLVDIEIEDSSGFQATMDLIQEPIVPVMVGKAPSAYAQGYGNYIRDVYTYVPIKAGQWVHELGLWKFVLPSEGSPDVELPFGSLWHETHYADRVKMALITDRPRTIWRVRQFDLPNRTTETHVLFRQYVYGPLPKGFLCFPWRPADEYWEYATGYSTSMIRARISPGNAWVGPRSLLRVVSPSGEERRALPNYFAVGAFSSTRWRTYWIKGSSIAGMDPLGVFNTEEGDYLVYEIGCSQSPRGRSVVVEVEFGDFSDEFCTYTYTYPSYYPPVQTPYSVNPFLTVWTIMRPNLIGEGQGDFSLPRRRPCRFVSIGEPVEWPEPSSQGNTAGLNEVSFGEYV